MTPITPHPFPLQNNRETMVRMLFCNHDLNFSPPVAAYLRNSLTHLARQQGFEPLPNMTQEQVQYLAQVRLESLPLQGRVKVSEWHCTHLYASASALGAVSARCWRFSICTRADLTECRRNRRCSAVFNAAHIAPSLCSAIHSSRSNWQRTVRESTDSRS